MKLTLLLACAVLALTGCATYTGGTADEGGVIYGADGTAYDAETGELLYRSGMALPVYKQPSPSGHDMGSNRPEFVWYAP